MVGYGQGMRGQGGQGRTRVVCKTLERRGKSLTPESRMEMLEERSWLVDCREETQEERADAMRKKELSARPTLRSNGSLSL